MVKFEWLHVPFDDLKLTLSKSLDLYENMCFFDVLYKNMFFGRFMTFLALALALAFKRSTFSAIYFQRIYF